MKAITLWQPWATLIALGLKQYETRSWIPSSLASGDWLAIHAAKRKTETLDWALPFIQVASNYEIETWEDLPLGAVIAVCRFRYVHTTEYARTFISTNERNAGDYSSGRYAWKLDNVCAFNPIPARGAQGLWDWQPPEGWEP